MSTPTDLEGRLTELFEGQARALHVPVREWSEVRQPTQPSRVRTRPGWPRVAIGVAAALPLVLALVLTTGDRGTQQVTTGGDGAPAGQPARLQVETRQVTMAADAVTIDVGGKRFVTTQPLEAHSDPGMPNEYTTLELTWNEHGVEMRMNIYFTSDGREWGSKEIRTYDGNAQGAWVTYEGDFFRSPLGTPFTGDFDARSSAGPTSGHLRMANLRLEAFRRPAACTTTTGPYALEPTIGLVTMTEPVAGYGVGVTLLDTASCAPVADPGRFTYQWRAQDPAVVAVGATGSTADLRAKGQGTTTVEVTARDRRTGETAASTRIDVAVNSQAEPGATSGGRRAGAAQP